MKNSLSMSSLVVGVAVRYERFMITLSRRFRRSEIKAMTKALCSCSGISREDALVSLTGGAAEVLASSEQSQPASCQVATFSLRINGF